ncbi:MAG TPA: hypothetical protein VGQ12_17000 [Candidatus Angelobacter sp.]|jgi:hypothetical protein|nr:hypothetical protein [Candidatus Angelobacter sp.]
MKVFVLALGSIASLGGLQCAVAQCGVERTDVKDMRDKAVVDVKMVPVAATVTELRKLKAPAVIGNTLPRQDSEKQVYVVQAWVIEYKHEAFNHKTHQGDGDYHVVISEVGKRKRTMIFEIPDPKCAPGNYAETFKQARAFIDSLNGAASATFNTLPKPVPVKLTFVLFFDKLHGQKGAAANGVEGHPGIGVERQ